MKMAIARILWPGRRGLSPLDPDRRIDSISLPLMEMQRTPADVAMTNCWLLILACLHGTLLKLSG